jgi:hypothetical protein
LVKVVFEISATVTILMLSIVLSGNLAEHQNDQIWLVLYKCPIFPIDRHFHILDQSIKTEVVDFLCAHLETTNKVLGKMLYYYME